MTRPTGWWGRRKRTWSSSPGSSWPPCCCRTTTGTGWLGWNGGCRWTSWPRKRSGSEMYPDSTAPSSTGQVQYESSPVRSRSDYWCAATCLWSSLHGNLGKKILSLLPFRPRSCVRGGFRLFVSASQSSEDLWGQSPASCGTRFALLVVFF